MDANKKNQLLKTKNDLQEYLNKINIDIAKHKDNPSSIVDKVNLASLVSIKQKIEEDIAEIDMILSETELEITCKGMPVKDHSISIDFFSKLLSDTQVLYNTILQVPFPEKIQGNNISSLHTATRKLYLVETLASSFKFRLQRNIDTENTLVDNMSNHAQKNLMSLLNNEISKETTQLLKIPQLRANYTDFLKNIATNNAEVGVRTNIEPRIKNINSEFVTNRIKWVNEQKFEDDSHYNINVIGKLIALNLKRQTYTISMGNNFFYFGYIDKNFLVLLKERVPISINIEVEAILRKKKSKKRTSFTLVEYK